MKKNCNYIVYKFLKYTVGMFYILLYRPKVINKGVIPKSGGVIICGNHFHAFDQFNVMMALKRVPHYMAKREYFDGVASLFSEPPTKLGCLLSKWAVEHAGMIIRVDRTGNVEEAKSEALEVLNQGKVLGLFPEGTRNNKENPPPFLLPFKFGAVSMAQKTGAMIQPFAITGEYKVFKKNHLNIRFGEPFKVPKTMDLQAANEKLYNIVADLKKQGLEDIKNGKY